LLDFAGLASWLNIPVFAGAAVAARMAGVRITLVERRDRTIFKMGYDSFAALRVYLSGLIVLYFLRDVTGGGG
jgi:hypothetical protein